VCRGFWGGRRFAGFLRTRNLLLSASFPSPALGPKRTHSLEFKSHQPLQRSFLKDQNSITRPLLAFHSSFECRTFRIDGLAFGQDSGGDGRDGDPELRKIFVLPDVFRFCCVDDPDSVEEGADSTRGRLYFVRAGGDEGSCECCEAGYISLEL